MCLEYVHSIFIVKSNWYIYKMEQIIYTCLVVTDELTLKQESDKFGGCIPRCPFIAQALFHHLISDFVTHHELGQRFL